MSGDEQRVADPDEEAGSRAEEPASEQSLQVVLNTFLSEVTAPGAMFGFAPGTDRAGAAGESLRRTGPMPQREIREVLDRYVVPDCFPPALDVLNTRGLVVLQGPSEVGKRAGGIALLSKGNPVPRVVGLSPGLTMRELAQYPFREGHKYLVLDRPGASDATETLAYDVTELSRSLLDADARLVITSPREARDLPDEFVFGWHAPDREQLLDACLSDIEVSAELRGRIVAGLGTASPRQVVAVSSALTRDGADGASVERILASVDRDAVLSWFDGEPAGEDVLTVAAMCFTTGLSTMAFEELLVRLESRVGPTAADEDGGEADLHPVLLSQRRRLRGKSIPFLIGSSSGRSEASEPQEERVAFSSDQVHSWVVRALWECYDRALWEPVRAWLRALPTKQNPVLAVSVARGLAKLAQIAPEYVRRSYVDGWAGAPSSRDRLLACYTIWEAAIEETTASWALESTLSWTGQSEEARLTAAMCLSGPLGLRFPAEAVRRLWRLAERGGRVGDTAQDGIVALVAGAITSEAVDTTGLNYVATRIRVRQSAQAPNALVAFGVVDRLMEASTPKGDPLLALVAQRAADLDSLGELWAAALINRPHRLLALRTLAVTMAALQREDPDLSSVESLGEAIIARLEQKETRLLERELLHQLAASQRGKPTTDARSIVQALFIGAHLASSQTEETNEPVSNC